jgi:hypothetical protein
MYRNKTLDAGKTAAFESSDSLKRKIENERIRVLGGKEFWAAKRSAFAPVLQRAVASGLFRDMGEVRSFFRDLEGQSEPAMDADGRLMLKVMSYGQPRELGLTKDNLLAPFSDRELALKLMIAKIDNELGMAEKNRSTAPEFQETWGLLQALLKEESAIFAAISKDRGRFSQTPVQVPAKKKLEKVLVKITH